MVTWTYGVTTVPDRLHTTLPVTVENLRNGGFDCPRLFIDGGTHDAESYDYCPMSQRLLQPLGPFGNWVLGMLELYVRNPVADRYAMFQDDILCCRNLRQYLDRCRYPGRGYWNLYTVPGNVNQVPGWYAANRHGKGACGLVFSREALVTLLSSRHIIERPQCIDRRVPTDAFTIGQKGVDGAIVDALRMVGWQEYVHNPSLVQHIGRDSVIDHKFRAPADTFPGEGFDALDLL